MRHNSPPLPPRAVIFLLLSLALAKGSPVSAQVIDADGDGVPDDIDNCTGCYNPPQADDDGDGLGDCWRCDWCDGPGTDTDWDGHCDDLDNCPLDWNQSQLDSDGDNIGDYCDVASASPTPAPSAPTAPSSGSAGTTCTGDDDGDGVCDERDNCRGCSNPLQLDRDQDGLGECWRCDWCDGPGTDTDWDGHCDDVDNCPLDWNSSQADRDGDGKGDACDPTPTVPDGQSTCVDRDNDSHCDDVDNCPAVANADQADADRDGIGDACDMSTPPPSCADGDEDGVCDDVDNCNACHNPLQTDRDGDGLGDCWRCDWCDGPGTDTDWDGHCDGIDNCPSNWNASQADADGDGLGDACDPQPNVPTTDGGCADGDFDGVCDVEDNCPEVWNASQADGDDDGVGDACDAVEPPPPPPDGTTCQESWTRYPANRTHSPITCAVTENLRRIAAREPNRRGRVFMKVGDSISAGHEFMSCFETETFSLSSTGHGSLANAHAWFLAESLGSTTSYARRSQATQASRTAEWALRGSPAPIEQEMWAINPRYALVMFGTNDMGYGGYSASAAVKFPWMYEHLVELVDWIAARGVVPVMYSIPPYTGQYNELRYLISTWNVVLRAVAEGRQIPFVDYYREMLTLPSYGLRTDGVHPNADYIRLCNFDDETGLIWGYNLRNLLSMQALDRVWQVTAPSPEREAWDASGATPLSGAGTPGSPRLVDTLPFAELTDLRESSSASLTSYGSCGFTASGRERVYRVTLSSPTPMRVMAIHKSDVDIDIAWLSSTSASSCQRANDTMLQGTFPAGTHYFVVDAPTASAEGEVVFLAAPCDAADWRCNGAP